MSYSPSLFINFYKSPRSISSNQFNGHGASHCRVMVNELFLWILVTEHWVPFTLDAHTDDLVSRQTNLSLVNIWEPQLKVMANVLLWLIIVVCSISTEFPQFAAMCRTKWRVVKIYAHIFVIITLGYLMIWNRADMDAWPMTLFCFIELITWRNEVGEPIRFSSSLIDIEQRLENAKHAW